MRQIKALVFFDMDGTLLSSKSTVLDEVKTAIHELRRNEGLPVIATGRSFFEVKPFMDELGIDSVISMNGQFIKYGDKVLIDKKIPSELCQKVLSYAEKRGDVLGFYNSQKIALSNDKLISRCFYKQINAPYPEINSDFYRNNPVNQLLVISKKADESYSRLFPELTFFITGIHSIDTVLKGNSKGQGVLNFAAASGFENIPKYAFGDGLNDVSLFKAVDHSIAMGNAHEYLKKIATELTETNDNLGIVTGLQSIGLI
ncbi:Cof-type HAD-IIB family hydrolase [Heyndrickxia faecalis]|uniref:Cof-type HAD-IIB family hydrolase n=1 Tax=Heyndrickxia faecalis TaxID=2824910 RepID=UPI003D1A3CB4